MKRIRTKALLAAVFSLGLMFSACRTLDELMAIFEDDPEETSAVTANTSSSKNKSTSSSSSTASTVKGTVNVNSTPDSSGFVARENRNFAQELGGYMETEYLWVESEIDRSKKDTKNQIKALSYSSYAEAYKNLPPIPDVTKIDTREKMSAHRNLMLIYCDAVPNYASNFKDELSAVLKKLDDAQMQNAIRASRGLPYDTELHFDPNADKYNAIIKKASALAEIISKEQNNSYNRRWSFNTSEEGYRQFLSVFDGIVCYKPYFNEFAPFRKQLCHEWFVSSQCKKIAQMDANLVARAKSENPKKTPQWFIDGRKSELSEVQSYNQQVLKRWIQKITPYLNKEKGYISQLIGYVNDIEAIRNGGEMTREYISAMMYVNNVVEGFFLRYFGWMDLVAAAPLVQTPPTFEGKKFKGYEHPELNYESEIINWGSRTIEY